MRKLNNFKAWLHSAMWVLFEGRCLEEYQKWLYIDNLRFTDGEVEVWGLKLLLRVRVQAIEFVII